ncbi:hypothetical protein [Candidatus Mycoplasma haematominutum]|uniref:hypothetical protein n=1 Tax=Candidatus Mycoplasma haematominutum TaxID=209446 RepID=UPI0002E7B032|nr:hypothetical protein [Candidatus Mycoplasma haematominutum]
MWTGDNLGGARLYCKLKDFDSDGSEEQDSWFTLQKGGEEQCDGTDYVYVSLEDKGSEGAFIKRKQLKDQHQYSFWMCTKDCWSGKFKPESSKMIIQEEKNKWEEVKFYRREASSQSSS